MKTIASLILGTTLCAICLGAHHDAAGQTFQGALYQFEDQSGPKLIDTNGVTTASVTGFPELGVVGSHGSALDFLGASTMAIDYRRELNSAQEFSVSFWFRPNSFNRVGRLVDTTGSTGAISQGYRIGMGSGDDSNNVRFVVRGRNGIRGATHPEELRAGFWYYCVASYKNHGALRLTVIRQGRQLLNLDAATISVDDQGPVHYSDQNDVHVGSAVNGTAAFDGAMDELFLDDAVLRWWRILLAYDDGTPPPRHIKFNLGSVAANAIDHDSSGAIKLKVASSDFFNLEDHGVMAAWERPTGNFQLETEILSVKSGRYPWAKSGIMVKSSGQSNSTSAGVFFTSKRGAVFQSRPVTGGLTSRVVADDFDSSGFVRLIRLGDSFHGAVSEDGVKWTSLGDFQWDQTPAKLVAGLAAAGQDDQPVVTRLKPPTFSKPSRQKGVFKLSLADLSAGKILRTFHNGDVVDLDYYQNALRIRASIAGSIGSVQFKVDGNTTATDSIAPYDFNLSGLANGEHNIEAIPYAGANGTGNRMDSLSADFQINRGTPLGRPNIVYILTDDMGFGDCGFNGSQDVITPNLDRLAASGVRCTSGYVTAPQCSTSRAGILSGMNQYRFGYELNTRRIGLPSASIAPLVPEVLQRLGYTNAMVGKWHVGVTEDPNTDHREDWLNGIIAGNHTSVMPWMRGFDYTYAMNAGGSSYFPYSVRGQNYLRGHLNNPNNLEVREGTTNPVYLRNLPATTHQTTELTARAINFIARNKANPFFLYLSYNAPHTPAGATEHDLYFNRHIQDKGRRELAGLMTGVDRQVGRLLDYLESEELLENTLIFFLSDNGGGENALNHSLNTPFRGGKGEVLEGGLRVPYVVSWKGQIPENRDFDAPVMSYDYIATALVAQGEPIPEYMDSVSILSDLQGKTRRLPATPRCTLYRDSVAWIRKGDYKYAGVGFNDFPYDYEIYSNTRYNVFEDDSAAKPPARVTDELDSILNAFIGEASDPILQSSFFAED
jgi:arylsulfatase A-like enzyme